MNIKLSNPRLNFVAQDYPLGGNKRGPMTFNVENGGKKGFRFTRQSTGKAKTATYGGKAAIVDGDNGRTYLIQFANMGGFIKINRADFFADTDVCGNCSVWPDHADYTELATLINQANPA